MITILTLIKNKSEQEMLYGTIRELAARLTDDKWEFFLCANADECREILKKEPVIDFLCVDVSDRTNLQYLPELRKKYEGSGLALVADMKVSPMEYLRPGIRPDTIVIKPFMQQSMMDNLEEFFMDRLSKLTEGDTASFMVETREGKMFIPYSQIYYFEAREKKIFIQTLYKEYGFYSTIEELAQQLPEGFVRSHRSFIVNVDKVDSVKGNMINLRQDFMVPLSRSYKSEFIEKMKG